jgi:F420-dependent oxidoreductase-like protein
VTPRVGVPEPTVGSGMRLGLNLGYWSAGSGVENLALAVEADRLGFSVVWAAEAYGSDSPTVLAWVAAQTPRIDVGSAVMQIPARSPAATAMTAATLDTLSAGRFRLGLGVSGPQVSEGWHGVRFDAPVGRTREYVAIVRQILHGERLSHTGRHYQLPLSDGPGKSLRLTMRPYREHLPIYLAAMGPKNLRLTGEVADGWLALFFSPEHAAGDLATIAEGRAWADRTMAGFDVVPTVPLSVDDDVAAAADRVRAYAALYLGGMGTRTDNFYNQAARRIGFEQAAEQIQDRYLARDYDGAAAAVPQEFLDATALLGPLERIAERMQAYAECGVTILSVSPHGASFDERVAALRTAAAALERSKVA